MPEDYKGRLETSVYETGDLDSATKKQLALERLSPERAANLKGSADLKKTDISAVALSFVPDEIGHSRHGFILGWSTEDDVRLEKAKELAAKAELDLFV